MILILCTLSWFIGILVGWFIGDMSVKCSYFTEWKYHITEPLPHKPSKYRAVYIRTNKLTQETEKKYKKL